MLLFTAWESQMKEEIPQHWCEITHSLICKVHQIKHTLWLLKLFYSSVWVWTGHSIAPSNRPQDTLHWTANKVTREWHVSPSCFISSSMHIWETEPAGVSEICSPESAFHCHASEPFLLSGASVDPLWAVLLRPATTNTHARRDEVMLRSEHTCRRRDRWYGDGNKAGGGGTTERWCRMLFLFPIVLCWHESESLREQLTLTGLIRVRSCWSVLIYTHTESI